MNFAYSHPRTPGKGTEELRLEEESLAESRAAMLDSKEALFQGPWGQTLGQTLNPAVIHELLCLLLCSLS